MVHIAPPSTLRRSLLIATVFQLGWVAAGIVCALLGVHVIWWLLVVNLLALWAPIVFMALTHIKFSYGFQIGFAIFVSVSSLVGSSLGRYAVIPNWDTAVHLYSGVLFAWFGYIIVDHAEELVKKPFPLWFKNIVAAMTPMALAAVWEIYEYTSDMLWGTTMQSGGLEDTIVDMASALLGAALMLIIYSVLATRSSRPVSD